MVARALAVCCLLGAVLMVAVAGTSQGSYTTKAAGRAAVAPRLTGLSKIKHIIMIMQENHSFDNYFGTYPGADGIPMVSGTPTVCSPNPVRGTCDAPYHDTGDIPRGGSHTNAAALAAINGGKMNGFDTVAAQACPTLPILRNRDPACSGRAPFDAMGYHNARDIPNYWA